MQPELDLEKFQNQYYSELHSAARHYDNKLWLALGIFISLLGFVANQLKFPLVNIENLQLLILISISSFLLLVKFLKEHAYSLWIQKKINEFDSTMNSRINDSSSLKKYQPLYSIPNSSLKPEDFDLTTMFIDLKQKFHKDPFFDSIWFEEGLIKVRISKLFALALLFATIGSVVLVGVIVLSYL